MGRESTGRAMRCGGPESVSSLIGRLRQGGSALGRGLREAKVASWWEEVVGQPLASHARPVRMRGGVLLVEADSSVWLHRMAMEIERVRRDMNRRLGEDFVEEIKLRLKGQRLKRGR